MAAFQSLFLKLAAKASISPLNAGIDKIRDRMVRLHRTRFPSSLRSGAIKTFRIPLRFRLQRYNLPPILPLPGAHWEERGGLQLNLWDFHRRLENY